MPDVCKLIGAPGSGKTTRLLETMDKLIDRGFCPASEMAFVSFTRSARAEAAERAADRFGVSAKRLQQEGNFRTLHSMCYRHLGVSANQLLSGGKDTKQWIEGALQMAMPELASGNINGDADQFTDRVLGNSTNASVILAIWTTARNLLQPFEVVWQIVRMSCLGDLPGLQSCYHAVARYEAEKLRDGKLDFTDLLGQYAGQRFGFHGHSEGAARGSVPCLPVLFHDEMQDCSALSAAVFRRLVNDNPDARYIYIAADPEQSIFSFAGTDPSHFLDWPAVKQEMMTKSWRCSRNVLRVAQRTLAEASRHLDREIEPACEGGSVESTWHRSAIRSIDPRESWLILARTNHQVKELQRDLDRGELPWVPLKGNGGWQRQLGGITALLDLEQGYPIDGQQFARILQVMPSVSDGQTMLQRGTKKRWDEEHNASEHDFLLLGHLKEFGVTDAFCAAVQDGSWKKRVKTGKDFISGCQRWGSTLATNPQIRVGTIHSAKGMEADNVAILTTLTASVQKGMQSERIRDEEIRVCYVGLTRARKRVLLIHEPRKRARMPIRET